MTREMAAIVTALVPAVGTLCGCVATSNFYSARMLEEGKVAIAVGADDIPSFKQVTFP